MRARLIQLTALLVLLTAVTPDLGILAAVIVVAVVAVYLGLVVPIVSSRVHGRPTAHRTFLQPEPSHPNTAGRPRPRAPGTHLQAA
jgi:hypothetical protein